MSEEELDRIWKNELSHGKENADPRIYKKVFSIDDITKALQGAHNPRLDIQKALLKLQDQYHKRNNV